MQRDLQDERLITRKLVLRLGLDHYPAFQDHIFFLRSDDNALDLMANLEQTPHDDIIVEWPKHQTPKYQLQKAFESEPLQIKVKGSNDWFEVEGQINIEGEVLELKKLLEALKEDKRYIQLKNGKWSRITETFRKRVEKLTTVIEQRGQQLSIGADAIALLEEMKQDREEIIIADAPALWRRYQEGYKNLPKLDETLPPTFQGKLRQYQWEGYLWMLRLSQWSGGACLADDMGLGKTIQTLALLLKRGNEGPSLIIAPTSLSHNWLKEASRFTPSLKPLLYRDSDRSSILYSLGEYDVVIMSYGLAQRDAEKLQNVDWNLLILDEAQAIKNAQTKRAKIIRTIPAKWTLALSGTPMENHLGELWSLFHTIFPELLGGFESFKKGYLIPIERYHSKTAKDKLQKKIRPFILRRLKKDCLKELPQKTTIDLYVELSSDERNLYEMVRLEAIQTIKKMAPDPSSSNTPQSNKQSFAILAALTKLRQIACHPSLVLRDRSGSSAKLELFKKVAINLKKGGHRALVFSQVYQIPPSSR